MPPLLSILFVLLSLVSPILPPLPPSSFSSSSTSSSLDLLPLRFPYSSWLLLSSFSSASFAHFLDVIFLPFRFLQISICYFSFHFWRNQRNNPPSAFLYFSSRGLCFQRSLLIGQPSADLRRQSHRSLAPPLGHRFKQWASSLNHSTQPDVFGQMI